MSTTTIQLKLVDVLGSHLDDHSVIADIVNVNNSTHFRAVVPLAGQTDVAIKLKDVTSDIYRIQLAPSNYRFIQFFLRLTEGETVTRDPVVFPVDPARVSGISAPAFGALDARLRALLEGSTLNLDGTARTGQALYDAMPAILKAALLNLFTKSSHTELGDQTSCFDHLHDIVELDRDRLFARSDVALLEEAMQSPDFRAVDFSLHKELPGYRLFTSFKTRDPHGNLQLTFSRKGETGGDYIVDMDIDEAQGIEHVFEVIRNSVTGLTNPYDVREILAATQHLEPLYGFMFAAQGEVEPHSLGALG